MSRHLDNIHFNLQMAKPKIISKKKKQLRIKWWRNSCVSQLLCTHVLIDVMGSANVWNPHRDNFNAAILCGWFRYLKFKQRENEKERPRAKAKAAQHSRQITHLCSWNRLAMLKFYLNIEINRNNTLTISIDRSYFNGLRQ